MTDSPLPDLKPIRLAVMGTLAGIYFLVFAGVWFFYDGYDPTDALLIIGGIMAGMWILQWIVLAGQANPDQRSGAALITLLAIAFGALDAILVCGWNLMCSKANPWLDLDSNDDWIPIFMLGGFVFGVLLVSLAGRRMPRYDFTRLMLFMHLIGTGLQGFMIFLPRWKEGPFRSQYDYADETFLTVMGGMGIVFFVVVLWWGIAPIAYLIAYRNYRRRMSMFNGAE